MSTFIRGEMVLVPAQGGGTVPARVVDYLLGDGLYIVRALDGQSIHIDEIILENQNKRAA